jgi:hypothetical protein
MTTTSASGVRVPVPAIPPKGPQISLLASSVAPADETNDFTLNGEQLALLPSDLKLELDARAAIEGGKPAWTRGIMYAPENSSAAVNRAPNDYTTQFVAFTPPNEPIVNCDPFVIVTKYECSTIGFEALDFKGRAQRQNDVASASAIALEFWDGAIAQSSGSPNNYLTKSGMSTIVNPSGSSANPVSLIDGLARLQDALRKGVGGQGMIHCIPGAAPNLLNVRIIGNFMKDLFGNIVVPDEGYSGNGPIGDANATPAAGYSWMFATDLVMTRIEKEAQVFPDSMAEAVDRGQNGQPNLVQFYAERMAMSYFDGFRQFAVYVQLP